MFVMQYLSEGHSRYDNNMELIFSSIQAVKNIISPHMQKTPPNHLHSALHAPLSLSPTLTLTSPEFALAKLLVWKDMFLACLPPVPTRKEASCFLGGLGVSEPETERQPNTP